MGVLGSDAGVVETCRNGINWCDLSEFVLAEIALRADMSIKNSNLSIHNIHLNMLVGTVFWFSIAELLE